MSFRGCKKMLQLSIFDKCAFSNNLPPSGFLGPCSGSSASCASSSTWPANTAAGGQDWGEGSSELRPNFRSWYRPRPQDSANVSTSEAVLCVSSCRMSPLRCVCTTQAMVSQLWSFLSEKFVIVSWIFLQCCVRSEQKLDSLASLSLRIRWFRVWTSDHRACRLKLTLIDHCWQYSCTSILIVIIINHLSEKLFKILSFATMFLKKIVQQGV